MQRRELTTRAHGPEGDSRRRKRVLANLQWLLALTPPLLGLLLNPEERWGMAFVCSWSSVPWMLLAITTESRKGFLPLQARCARGFTWILALGHLAGMLMLFGPGASGGLATAAAYIFACPIAVVFVPLVYLLLILNVSE